MLQSALSQVYGPPWDPSAGATAAQPSIGGSAAATGGMPVMSPTLRTQMQNDPRLAMIAMFAKNGADTSPAKGGWGEAIARALTGAIAGHEEKGVEDEYSQAQTSRNSALKDALSQTDPNKVVSTLAANPATADIAADYSAKLFDLNAANAAKGNEPVTPYQRAQLGGERITDAQGNVISKYNLGAVNQALQGISGVSPVAGATVGTIPGDAAPSPMQPGGGQGGILPPPAVLGGPAGANAAINPATPKAVNAMQEAVGKNLADTAAPKAADDTVNSLTNTLAMIKDAQALNPQAYDGMIKGPATQLVGRVFGDNALDPAAQASRDAYSQMEQKTSAIAAEATKPLFGSAQLSDADRVAAAKAASVLPTASKAERAALFPQIAEIIERKRDLAALERDAAQQGRVVSPADIQGYYASKGIDYQTGAKIQQPAAPAGGEGLGQPMQQQAQPAGAAVKVNSPADALKLPKGTHFVDPNGVTRVVP